MFMGVLAVASLSFLVFMVAVVLASFGKANFGAGTLPATTHDVTMARNSYKFRQAFRNSARPLPRVLSCVVVL